MGTYRITSPYLNRPLVPLTVALPRMLEKIETELAGETGGLAEKRWLQERAGLIRRLLKPDRLPTTKKG